MKLRKLEVKSGLEILLVVAFAMALALIWGGCATAPERKSAIRRREPIAEIAASSAIAYAQTSVQEIQPTVVEVKSMSALDDMVYTYIHVPGALKAELKNATEANVQAVLAQIESGFTKMKVSDVEAVLEIATREKWYDMFEAVPGGHMWWILKIARERDQNGEDISKWETEFKNTMNEWLMEGD